MPYNAGVAVLQDLIKFSGRGLKQAAQGSVDYTTRYSPVALLGQLIGHTSGFSGQQDLKQSLVGTQTEQAIKQGKIKDPFLLGAEKALKESGYSMAQESIAVQGPELTIQKLMEMEQQGQQNPKNQIEEPLAQESLRPPQVLQPKGLFTTQTMTPEGDIQLGGPFAMGGMSLEKMKLLQELSGKSPLQQGRQEELNIMHENRKMEIIAAANAQGEKITEERASALTAAESWNSLFNLRESIVMRGPVKGQLGAIGGAIGLGTDQRAEFDSSVNQFVFDVGTLLGQKGRAFSEKEQKLVREKVIQGSLSAKDSDFIGRMNAIAKRINSMAGETIIPRIEDIKKMQKKDAKQKKSFNQSWTPEKESRYQELLKKQQGK